MASTLTLPITDDGLHLPRRLFPQVTEVEVIEGRDYILIKPTSSTQAGNNLMARAALQAAGMAVIPEWPMPPPVDADERAELARKLASGKPLSEIIVELRADRA